VLGRKKMNRKYLGKIVDVIIDIQMGNAHPEFPNTIYPINYGHIPGTISGDGEELDAFVLGINKPIKEFKGEVIAIIHRTNDDDDKLIVVEKGNNYSNDEIKEQVEFIEKYFKSVIIR